MVGFCSLGPFYSHDAFGMNMEPSLVLTRFHTSESVQFESTHHMQRCEISAVQYYLYLG